MQNPENYIANPLNTSVSKITYTFSKSQRQTFERKVLNHSSYQIPSARSKRAAGIGYGVKSSVEIKSCSPPPGAYNLKSEFEDKLNSNAIAVGKSREDVKFGSYLDMIQKKKRIPAPNYYKIKLKTFNKRGGKIGYRLPTQIDQAQKNRAPGPGTYKIQSTNMNNSGNFFCSKFVNPRSSHIHPEGNQFNSSHKRNKTELGPAVYKTEDGKFGSSVLSGFRNSISGTFPKSERKGIIDKQKLKIPGHKYKRFSDFGISS